MCASVEKMKQKMVKTLSNMQTSKTVPGTPKEKRTVYVICVCAFDIISKIIITLLVSGGFFFHSQVESKSVIIIG